MISFDYRTCFNYFVMKQILSNDISSKKKHFGFLYVSWRTSQEANNFIQRRELQYRATGFCLDIIISRRFLDESWEWWRAQGLTLSIALPFGEVIKSGGAGNIWEPPTRIGRYDFTPKATKQISQLNALGRYIWWLGKLKFGRNMAKGQTI